MAEGGFVAARAARQVRRDFPRSPTLVDANTCAGLAFVGSAPSLRPLRDHIAELRHGAPDGLNLTIALFAEPLALASDSWPTGLRLLPVRPGCLASFADRSDPPRSVAPGPVTLVELWWQGERYRVALDALAPAPVTALWDLPQVTVHRATTTPRRSRSGTPLVAASARRLQPDAPALAVRRAATPVTRDGEELLGAMAQRLRDETRAGLLDRLRGRGRQRTGAGDPGLLAAVAGWLRWQLPGGGQLGRQLAQRLKEVDRLIAGGEVDAALRLALRLGDGANEDGRTRYPSRLPAERARLDFDLGPRGFSAPVLGLGDFGALAAHYRTLAEQLERTGDHRRAAFIHAQLLGDHARAVALLEAGGLLRDAARLALDAGLDPVIAICLFYAAGERDAALALARRLGCFEALVEQSRDGDAAFHGAVLAAWTDALVATGQPLRALQVTDRLAVDGTDEHLAVARRRWLDAALAAAGADGWRGELAARGLFASAWHGTDAGAFPHARPRGDTPLTLLLDCVQADVRGDSDDARAALLALFEALDRFGDPERPEQASFWAGPALPILDGFTRGLVTLASDALSSTDLGTLASLLRRARLPVLATDIRKLKLPRQAAAPDGRSPRLPRCARRCASPRRSPTAAPCCGATARGST